MDPKLTVLSVERTTDPFSEHMDRFSVRFILGGDGPVTEVTFAIAVRKDTPFPNDIEDRCWKHLRSLTDKP